MKIVYNRLLPFRGYAAMAFFGVILARRECRPLSASTVRHEDIHMAQAADCRGWILFYLRYLWYWLRYGYRRNPFEREAYENEQNADYLKNRKLCGWADYL